MVKFKKLNFILAIVLIVCFIPMSAFAVSTDKSSTDKSDDKTSVKADPKAAANADGKAVAASGTDADTNADKVTYKKDIKITKQFLVNITRPANKESTVNTSYIICGNTEKEDVIIELFIYSKDDNCYVPFRDADGEYSWKIKSFFSKEVELKKAANDVMIIAYQKTAPGVIQVSKFTINVLGGSIKEIIKKRINKTIDLVKSILGK